MRFCFDSSAGDEVEKVRAGVVLEVRPGEGTADEEGADENGSETAGARRVSLLLDTLHQRKAAMPAGWVAYCVVRGERV